jgi:GntR family transcriptional regulator
MIQFSGAKPGVQHISLSLETASEKLIEKLALSAGEEVLATTNVFKADDVPVIYCLDVIPASLVRSAYRAEELHGPVYDFLEKRCGQRVDHNITEVCPVVAGYLISRRLNCKPGSPLHYFEEVAFNAEGVPVMYSEEYYRPEYFSFNVIRKMTTHRRT